MRVAVGSVTFSRSSRGVSLMLTVEDALVFEGSDVTQTVCEIVNHGVTEIRLSNTYSIKVPTNCDTLAEAAKQSLDEPLAVFILISACAW